MMIRLPNMILVCVLNSFWLTKFIYFTISRYQFVISQLCKQSQVALSSKV